MDLSEYIEQFLQYIAERRRFSPRTVDTYRKSLVKFLEHLGGAPSPATNADAGNAPALSAFSEMNVKGFVWDLKMKQKLAPTSICEHLAALKSFGKCLIEHLVGLLLLGLASCLDVREGSVYLHHIEHILIELSVLVELLFQSVHILDIF